MKKIVGFLGMVILGIVSPAWAASVGAPSATTENRLETTVEYTRVFDRDLEAPAQETDEITLSNQVHLKASYLIFPWLQPYAKLGTAVYEQKQSNTNIVGLGRRNINYEYDWGFSWGGGLAATRTFGDGWFLGGDTQYLRSDHDLDAIRHSGQTGSNLRGEVSVEEFHVATYFGKNLEVGEATLSPYVGGRWSNFDFDIDENISYDISEGTVTVTGSTNSDDEFGVFVGLGYQMPNRWRFAVEGRFIDETAVTGQVSYTF